MRRYWVVLALAALAACSRQGAQQQGGQNQVQPPAAPAAHDSMRADTTMVRDTLHQDSAAMKH